MRFFDGFTLLGSSPVSGGVATLAWSPPHLGSRTLSALYSGDGKFFGSISRDVIERVVSTLLLVADGTSVPQTVSLAAPHPNPARTWAALRFGLPRNAAVSIAIFDVTGRLVRELAGTQFAAGEHALTWDLCDSGGAPVSSGLLFVRMNADGLTRTGRLVVVR